VFGVCWLPGWAGVSLGHGFAEKSNTFPDIVNGSEKGFQAAVPGIAGPESPAKVTQIVFEKSAVNTARFKFSVISFHYECVGAWAHKGEHFFSGFEDQIPAAPSYRCGKERRYLPVRAGSVAVRKLDRIKRDKFRLVGVVVKAIQFGF